MAEQLTPDLCIIGAGAAGLGAAFAACALGASVVVVERGPMGGDWLNAGSILARAVAAAGAQVHAIRAGAGLGIAAEAPRVNFRKLHERVQEVVAGLAPQDAAARLEALGAHVVAAAGRFTDPRTVTAGDYRIRARRFIIATGSHPVVPPIPGLEAVPYFTNETIFANTRRLTHLVIVGGADTGLELAQAYARLGTQVTVIEAARPLAGADPELAEVALRRMQEEGVAIRAGAAVAAIRTRSQGIGVELRTAAGEEMLDASHILVAGTRLPNLDGLDLERANIRRVPRNRALLQLTPRLRTSNRRVYAAGDATGPPTAGAAEQGRRLARRLLLGSPLEQPHPPATVVYTDPEIAAVGLTEAEARARHGDGVQVLRCGFAGNARARVLGQSYGVAKLLTTRNGRLLGAGIVGPAAGELIALLALAIGNRLSARQLEQLAVPEPTLSEIAVRLGAEFAAGRPPGPWRRLLPALMRRLP